MKSTYYVFVLLSKATYPLLIFFSPIKKHYHSSHLFSQMTNRKSWRQLILRAQWPPQNDEVEVLGFKKKCMGGKLCVCVCVWWWWWWWRRNINMCAKTVVYVRTQWWRNINMWKLCVCVCACACVVVVVLVVEEYKHACYNPQKLKYYINLIFLMLRD